MGTPFPPTPNQTQLIRPEPSRKVFTPERYESMVSETFIEIQKLAKLKGGEYSGDIDRLENFRRNGRNLELPMEKVLLVYAGKHWDALNQYAKDIQNGKERTRLESITGRVDDLIVYALLFKAMIIERSEDLSNA